MPRTILFGERERALRFDIAAMLDLEAAMGGKSTGEIVAGLASWNLTALVLVLWAGLKGDQPKLTVASVRAMLERYVTQEGANLRVLRDQVREAIEDATWFQQAISSGDGETPPDTDDDAGNA